MIVMIINLGKKTPYGWMRKNFFSSYGKIINSLYNLPTYLPNYIDNYEIIRNSSQEKYKNKKAIATSI